MAFNEAGTTVLYLTSSNTLNLSMYEAQIHEDTQQAHTENYPYSRPLYRMELGGHFTPKLPYRGK